MYYSAAGRASHVPVQADRCVGHGVVSYLRAPVLKRCPATAWSHRRVCSGWALSKRESWETIRDLL